MFFRINEAILEILLRISMIKRGNVNIWWSRSAGCVSGRLHRRSPSASSGKLMLLSVKVHPVGVTVLLFFVRGIFQCTPSGNRPNPVLESTINAAGRPKEEIISRQKCNRRMAASIILPFELIILSGRSHLRYRPKDSGGDRRRLAIHFWIALSPYK